MHPAVTGVAGARQQLDNPAYAFSHSALFERFSQRLLDSDVIATARRLDVRDEIGGQTEADLFLRRGDPRATDRPYASHGLRQLRKHLSNRAQVHVCEIFISQFADLAFFVG